MTRNDPPTASHAATNRFVLPLTLPRLLIGALILAVGFAAARLLAIQGWWRPVRVVSGSMAEGLLGEHFSVTCVDCRFEFRYGVESVPAGDRAVCPNCGFASLVARHAIRKRGERVLIDRAAYWFESPRRFDLVAFRDPRQPARRLVKRVVGLPDEQVAVRHGDLYINGQLLRKSLADFHRSAILVHDQRFAPQPQQHFLPRWRPVTDPSGWQLCESGVRYDLQPLARSTLDSSVEEVDWLGYYHWRCYANPYPRSTEAPVADNLGYNQGESRALQEVSDLILEFNTRLSATTQLRLRIHDGREWFTVAMDGTTRRIMVQRGATEIAATSWPTPLPTEDCVIAFGALDRQVIVAAGGEELVRKSYEPASLPWQPLTNPVSVGGGTAVQISDLRVLRDVYYLDPWAVGQRWETPGPAGKGQYLVLGDNPALSDDSRKWQDPWLPATAILGRVIPLESSRE